VVKETSEEFLLIGAGCEKEALGINSSKTITNNIKAKGFFLIMFVKLY